MPPFEYAPLTTISTGMLREVHPVDPLEERHAHAAAAADRAVADVACPRRRAMPPEKMSASFGELTRAGSSACRRRSRGRRRPRARATTTMPPIIATPPVAGAAEQLSATSSADAPAPSLARAPRIDRGRVHRRDRAEARRRRRRRRRLRSADLGASRRAPRPRPRATGAAGAVDLAPDRRRPRPTPREEAERLGDAPCRSRSSGAASPRARSSFALRAASAGRTTSHLEARASRARRAGPGAPARRCARSVSAATAASFSTCFACGLELARARRGTWFFFWRIIVSARFCAVSARCRAAACSSATGWFACVLGVRRVAQHRRDPRAAEVREVLLVVGDVLHLEHVELEAELVEVVARVLDELLGELEPVLVHLLGRELADDLAQHALERLLRDERDLLRPARRGSARRRCGRRRRVLAIFMFAIACTLSGMPPFE